jgi:hypothetical protein
VKTRACDAVGYIRPIRPAPSRINICFRIIPPFSRMGETRDVS